MELEEKSNPLLCDVPMNKQKIRVIMYGESILLAGLETTLRKDPSFFVVQRLNDLFELEQTPRSQFDLVIFDSTLAEAKVIPAILERSPGLIVVGVDIPSDHMTVYSGKGFALGNIADLSNLICNQNFH